MNDINNTGITPIRDQILVRRDEPEKMTRCNGRMGLYLPDGSERWPPIGTVLAVGPSVRDPEIVPGVRVLFNPRPGSALVPDWREVDHPERERVVVLRSGDVESPGDRELRGPVAGGRWGGDILGIVEEG